MYNLKTNALLQIYEKKLDHIYINYYLHYCFEKLAECFIEKRNLVIKGLKIKKHVVLQESLSLVNNGLRELDDSLSNLMNLRAINCRHNKLKNAGIPYGLFLLDDLSVVVSQISFFYFTNIVYFHVECLVNLFLIIEMNLRLQLQMNILFVIGK